VKPCKTSRVSLMSLGEMHPKQERATFEMVESTLVTDRHALSDTEEVVGEVIPVMDES
jgi:hypothetical protein